MTEMRLRPATELAVLNGVRFPNESDAYRRARVALLDVRRFALPG
jgi:hypothetical protein